MTTAHDAGFAQFGFCPDFNPDLQVGEPVTHLFIASQDVAQNLELLQSLGITHILNVATGISNAFPKVCHVCVHTEIYAVHMPFFCVEFQLQIYRAS